LSIVYKKIKKALRCLDVELFLMGNLKNTEGGNIAADLPAARNIIHPADKSAVTSAP
jgi:hypothetical protein